MRARIYLRVARDGYKYKVDAGIKSSEMPLSKAVGYPAEKVFLPTVGFAVDFEIPDAMFSRASVVIAEINVQNKDVKILSAIPKPEPKKK